MKTLDWYFDFVSPFSYLQQEVLDRLPPGVALRHKPLLFAGLLQAWGHKGPAEIPAKRTFTYRMAVWQAQCHGIPLRFPPAHPFNPLKALRLAVALDCDPEVIRHIFRFIWREGRSIEDPRQWQRLTDELRVIDADVKISMPHVKEQLRANGEEALAHGVFGVPTAMVGGELFWGFDATELLLDYLNDPGLFQRGELARASELPEGTQRRT